jgi:hypothetical protein
MYLMPWVDIQPKGLKRLKVHEKNVTLLMKVETYAMDKRSEGRSYSVDHTGMVHNSGYNVNESLKGMSAGE